MSSIQSSDNMQFLSGGGEMGALTRSKDWSQTALGNPDTWPQSLRIILGIILNSKFPMFLWWGEELVCFYNDAYRPSLGNNGKHPSILGMSAKDAWPEIWDIIKPLINQVLSGGEATWHEDQLIPIYRNGQLEDVYWTFSYSPVYDESGSVGGVLVTCNETTEKVKLLKTMAESEERFRNMAEDSEILIGVSDEKGVAVFFNKSWCDLTGKSMKELLEDAWLTVLHPDDYPVFFSLYTTSLEKQIPFSGEFRARHNDGNYRWFSFKSVPRFHSDGSFAGYISSSIDITENKFSAAALKESELRFRNVANTAPVLVWMTDSQNKGSFFNSAWLNFTGRTIGQESGEGWQQGVHPEDIVKLRKTYDAAFDAKEEFYAEYRLKRNDGAYRWISDRGLPRFGLKGEFEGFIGACMDIHDKVVGEQKIKENEERLNVIIEASGLATWELNLKTSEIGYSDRYLEMMGYNNDTDLSHQKLLNRLHPDDLPIRAAAFEEAFKTGILRYEGRIIWDDKSVHWFEGRGKLFYDDKGEPEKLVGTSRDITEEKNFELELIKREEKFRLLADSMPQYIWTADTQGNLDYFNQSVFTYSGLTVEQMNNDGWYQIMHPDDREENRKTWEAAVSKGIDFIFEHRFRRNDGEYRWQLSRAIPQKAEGVIQMWVGTSTDIQDQKLFTTELEKQVRNRTKELKELNETLAKSEERYHLMVEEVQDYAILYLNREGNIENWNKGAEKIKGYAAKEIIGQNFSIFYTEEDRKNNLPQHLMKIAIETGRARQEGWRVRKGGTPFWASVTITAVHNAKGEIIGFSKVTHDLTEKKETSEQLVQNAQQLEQKNAELQKMNKELESFAYISSHDLQEPLRKIQTFSSRILEKEYDSLSEGAKDNFMRMQSAAKRMQVLIEDLLVYSRTSDAERKYVNSDLRKLIEDVKEEMDDELLEKNVTIEIGEMGKADVIPFQFRQLFQNLLSNSLKFSKTGTDPVIKITNEVHKGSFFNIEKLNQNIQYCHIQVSDNGIGFDPDYSEKIFEVFQRLHGKNEYIGTGIGLAIVKKIVENLNGYISATGKIGAGATFDIYFPVSAKKQ
jgi:PAS domain S-box-containing protein